MLTLCPNHNHLWNTIDVPGREFVDEDLMLFYFAIAPPIQETILGCGEGGGWLRICSNLFRMIYTDQGICYTFNGIMPDELYRDNVYVINYQW